MRKTTMLAAVSLAAGAALATGPARAENPVYNPRVVVEQATAVIDRMTDDTNLDSTLYTAEGVFVVPKVEAFSPPVAGAQGIALARRGATWTGPAFFALSGAGFGKKGASGPSGAVVLMLLTDKAVDAFAVGRDGKVDLAADSGLDIEHAGMSAPSGTPDVLVWSSAGEKGIAARLGRATIVPSAIDNSGYYRSAETPKQVLAGDAPLPAADELWNALSG